MRIMIICVSPSKGDQSVEDKNEEDKRQCQMLLTTTLLVRRVLLWQLLCCSAGFTSFHGALGVVLPRRHDIFYPSGSSLRQIGELETAFVGIYPHAKAQKSAKRC